MVKKALKPSGKPKPITVSILKRAPARIAGHSPHPTQVIIEFASPDDAKRLRQLWVERRSEGLLIDVMVKETK